MDDAGEGSRATRRQVLGATAGALAVGALPGHSSAQQASGPTVYVGSFDETLYAVDAATGEQEWAFNIQQPVSSRSSPTVVDGTVYIGSIGTLYAVDAATGEEKWAWATQSFTEFSSPTLVDGKVYVGGDDGVDEGSIFVLDAGTGNLVNEFNIDSGIKSSVSVVDEVVYAGSHDNDVYAFDTVTDNLIWKFETDGSFWSHVSSPTVVDGTVYVGSGDNNIYALESATGDSIWDYETDSGVRSSPTVVDGTVYVGGMDSRVYALDAGTGDKQWEFKTDWNVYSSPTVVEEIVYVGGRDNNVYALDAETGNPVWTLEAGDNVLSSPTVADGTVYVGSNDETLYAVDAATGDQEWAFNTSGSVGSSPTVVADPASGDSVGSRVMLGTLGHHDDRSDRVTKLDPANFEVTIEQTTEPVAGERLEVTAGVANTGDSSGTQTVDLTVSGLGSDSTTVSLDGGNSTEQVLSVSTGEDDDGDYTATVESEDDSAQQTVTVRRPVTYPVGITDATSPVAGETLEVTAAVENTGDVSGTQTVALEVPGLGTDSVAVSLDSGESTTQALSVPTEDGDAGEYTATVTTDDHSDEQDVTVLAPAAFTVEVTDTTGPVAGDPLEVTVDVENTGDTQDTQTLGLDVPGLGSDSTDVSLDAGASTELTLSVPTGEGDAGEYTTTVESDDDSDEQDVTVLTPAAFTVDITDTSTPVAGDPLEVTVDVENTGDDAGDQTVELSVPDLGSDSTTISLDGGSATTETLSLSTGEGDAGEYTVTVDSGDDSDTRDATVLAPAAFTVEVTEVTEPVAGDPLEVTVDVENTGDDAGDQTVELSVPDLGSDSTTVSLDGDDATTETLSLSTADGDAGEYTATVESKDDSTQQTVAVLAPAAFTVTITDVSAPVAGEPLNVAVSVENTGDDAGDQTVELTAPGLGSNSTTVSLGGGESTSETLSLSTGEGDAGEYTVTAQTDDDEATATATVSEPAGGGDTGSPGGGAGAGGDDGNTPGDNTSSNDSTDPTGDGGSTGDGGLGTTEMAAVGGGGGLALLLGAYALMRRSGDDESDSTSESTSSASTGGESSRQPSPSPSPSPGPGPDAGRQRDTSNAGGVPSRIPDTPRPSLSYEDITIGDPLGRGGNADVYYATAATPQGDLELAVKEPRMGGGETLNTEVVERMMQEAETWQQLDDHDHVAGVVDYGTQPLPWIAMEYMDRGHLGERAGEMDTAQKLWTALSVTEGVYHAHNRGIAHRDLKPENILFRRVDGAWDAPKVADWGLSKHLLEHSKSRDGMTVEYAAPEQFSDSASTDDRTDIYQLGAVFYELFTGGPPFEGEMFTVMEQIKTETPTPPSEIADVPDGLDEILLRALAKEPDDRYSDIVYLRDDLQELFDQP